MPLDDDDAILPLLGGVHDDELLTAWDEAEEDAARVLRDALADQRTLPPPAALTAAGRAVRAGLEADDPRLDWVRPAADLDPALELVAGVPLAGEDLLWELTAATIAPEADPGLPPEEQADLLLLELADWAGAIIEVVRAGPGSPADPATLVAHIDRCPEVSGPPTDPGDAELLEHALDLRVPAWQALGVVDRDRRLTEVGAWLLPRAACTAWASDFDHPDDDPFDADEAADDPFSPDEWLGPVADPYGPDDVADDEYDEVAPEVARLAGDFAAWLETAGLSSDVDWVVTLLDLRLTYLDDALTTWRQEDLRELLVEVCPRRLSAGSEEIPEALTSLSGFLEFLGATALLSDASEPVDRLTAWLRHAEPTVAAAMDDPSRWGPAKSLVAALEVEGVDPSDRAAVEAWMADFNHRPVEERDALLGRFGPAADLPPQLLPSDEELAAQVRATRLWQQLTGLVTYVGDGLPVTDAGNVKLADARRLVERLETGDVIDPPSWGDTHRRTRSSTELAGLTRTFELAQVVGLLERRGRKVHPQAARLTQFRDEPVAIWEELVIAWMRHGFLTSLYGGHRTWWSGQLDALVVDMLIAAAESEQPMPLDRLAELLAEERPFAPLTIDRTFAEWLRDDVHRWAEQLEVAGLVSVRGTRSASSRDGRPRRHGGKVTATPLSLLLLAHVAGAPVHQRGALRDADAATMLDALTELPIEAAEAEMAAWLGARPATVAAEEVGAVLFGAPRERILAAFLTFDELGSAARAVVEGLQQDPVTGIFARAWLVQHGYADLRPGAEDDALDGMLAILTTLASVGPDAVVAAVEQLGDAAEQIAFLEQAWRSASPETTAILEAIGDLHPDKRVRKAARKAAFKRRSTGA